MCQEIINPNVDYLYSCRYKRQSISIIACPGFCLLLFLDNHDTNRILFSCNGNRMLMDEAVEFTLSLPYPTIIYYGTETYMTNRTDINDCTPYADLEVREPMDWS